MDEKGNPLADSCSRTDWRITGITYCT
jgi:hypothetical protein